MKSKFLVRVKALFLGGRMVLCKEISSGHIIPCVSYIDPFGSLVCDFKRNKNANTVTVDLDEEDKTFKISKKRQYSYKYPVVTTEEYLWTYGPDDIGDIKRWFSDDKKENKEVNNDKKTNKKST